MTGTAPKIIIPPVKEDAQTEAAKKYGVLRRKGDVNMNVRKPIDYNPLYRELNDLLVAELPQMKLYCEIGKLVNSRPEKGAAVAAAEYLIKAYPDASGFSPRNLRRMRDFYRAYEGSLDILTEARDVLKGCQGLLREARRGR